MVNTITKAERQRILRRAQELQAQDQLGYNARIDQIQAEFNISRQRARSAVAEALRISRYKGSRK